MGLVFQWMLNVLANDLNLCIHFFLSPFIQTHTSLYLKVKFFTFWEGNVYSWNSLNVYDIRSFMSYEPPLKRKQAVKVLFRRVHTYT